MARHAAFAVLLVAVAFAVCADAQIDHDMDFGIMMDAGSSGTRIYVYSWPHRASSSSVAPYPQPVSQVDWSKKIKPGVSSFANDFPGLEAHLGGLLEFVQEVLAPMSYMWQQIPIFLGATAGVRVLPLQQRLDLMDYIRLLLLDKSFCPFYFQPEFARILSGEEEGVFGYLTVNYILNTLDKGVPAGALDLGGASTQITFAPSGDVLAGFYDIHVEGVRSILYTHSFLYYGINQAELRAKELASEVNGTAINVDYPCFLRGQTATYNAQTPARTVTLVGSGNQLQCALLAFSLLEKYVPCWAPESCSFLGVYQPPLLTQEIQPPIPIPNSAKASRAELARATSIRALSKRLSRSHNARVQPTAAAAASNVNANANANAPKPQRTLFYGFSNYGEIAESTFLLPNATLLEWQARAREICSMSWQDLKDSRYNNDKGMTLAQACFGLTYIITILHEGYGFDMNSTDQLRLQSNLGEDELSWALGAMLYEANLLPFELIDDCPNTVNLTPAQFSAFAAIMSLLVVGLSGGVAYLGVRLRRERRSYDKMPRSGTTEATGFARDYGAV